MCKLFPIDTQMVPNGFLSNALFSKNVASLCNGPWN